MISFFVVGNILIWEVEKPREPIIKDCVNLGKDKSFTNSKVTWRRTGKKGTTEETAALNTYEVC